MVTRVAGMALRLCALVAIVLGILFWTGNADQLRGVHMTVGIVLVLSLWVLAFAQATTPGGIVWLIAALLVGVALPVIGVAQESIVQGPDHWIIQVAHLGVALVAVGLGEMTTGRTGRAAKAKR